MAEDNKNIEEMVSHARDGIESSMAELYPSLGKLDGKKLRGALPVIIGNEFNGNLEKAIKYGCAVEFIHQGSLFHDDVLDEHEERRGNLTTFITEGVKKAVMKGDLMFTSALRIGAESGSEEAIAVVDTMQSMLTGAIEEMSLPDSIEKIMSGEIEDDIYYRIIDMKTAVLFGCASRFGAMSFTKDKKTADRFMKFGVLMGEAYQIADDMVDIIKMANETEDITPLSVIPIIPAIVKYNKSTLKSLPFKLLAGKIKPKSKGKILSSNLLDGMEMISSIVEEIGDIDVTGKMMEDINKKLKEAGECVPESTVLPEYARYAVNQMLSEVGMEL